jgi:pimeloyl-ACP methyl ester carboxylesterase
MFTRVRHLLLSSMVPLAIASCGSESDGTNVANADANQTEERYPIIFVHGHNGDLTSWKPTVEWVVANDAAHYKGWNESGTEDHAAWTPRSIPADRWLFDFTYYNKHATDPLKAYTAGPGRVGSNAAGVHCDPSERHAGYIITDHDPYNGGVTHEFSADLGAFVSSVLRATGAKKVDLVAHSMGGLISRSYLQFYEGHRNVRRLLTVSTPHHGAGLSDLGNLTGYKAEGWMKDHELAELDDKAQWFNIKFRRCDVPEFEGAWHESLNVSDEDAAAKVTFFTMVGDKDRFVSRESASYDRAKWNLVVPGYDHSGMITAPETRAKILETLGK